eukprot:6195391-Pleurochrysis_carterae.AAC.1
MEHSVPARVLQTRGAAKRMVPHRVPRIHVSSLVHGRRDGVEEAGHPLGESVHRADALSGQVGRRDAGAALRAKRSGGRGGSRRRLGVRRGGEAIPEAVFPQAA